MGHVDTFIARCIRGSAVPAQANVYVENWHEGRAGCVVARVSGADEGGIRAVDV